MTKEFWNTLNRTGALFTSFVAMVSPSLVGRSFRDSQIRHDSEMKESYLSNRHHIWIRSNPPENDVEAWNRDLVSTIQDMKVSFLISKSRHHG